MKRPLILPKGVREAFDHVRRLYPEVTQVFLGTGGHWLFTDDDMNAVDFSSGIDVDILEYAVSVTDGLIGLPYAWRYAEELKTFSGLNVLHVPGSEVDLAVALEMQKGNISAEFYERNGKVYASWMLTPGGITFFREEAVEVDPQTALRLSVQTGRDNFVDITNECLNFIWDIQKQGRLKDAVDKEFMCQYLPPHLYEVTR